MNTELIRTIHDSPLRLAMAVTGGGSLAVGDLLVEPGASRTVLEAVVPYGERALIEFLSHRPEQFCSEKTARRMAMAAFVRALHWSQADGNGREKNDDADDATSNLIGVGCTCSLASDRPKRGEHRAHWAVQSVAQTLAATVVFAKGTRSRIEEERLAADLLVTTIAAFAGRSHEPKRLADSLQKLLRRDETVVLRMESAPRHVRDVLFGRLSACRVLPNDRHAEPTGLASDTHTQFLFPGSFDPMHRGHRRMIEIVRRKFGENVRVALEIAVRNVDKPPADYLDLSDRMASIAQTPDTPVWLTQFARFVEKSDYFRGVTFVVGTDTLKRIAQPQYYRDGNVSVETVIDQLTANRCRFLCFARHNERGETETAESLALPEKLREIVTPVPSSEFCDEISSTRLRRCH